MSLQRSLRFKQRTYPHRVHGFPKPGYFSEGLCAGGEWTLDGLMTNSNPITSACLHLLIQITAGFVGLCSTALNSMKGRLLSGIWGSILVCSSQIRYYLSFGQMQESSAFPSLLFKNSYMQMSAKIKYLLRWKVPPINNKSCSYSLKKKRNRKLDSLKVNFLLISLHYLTFKYEQKCDF